MREQRQVLTFTCLSQNETLISNFLQQAKMFPLTNVYTSFNILIYIPFHTDTLLVITVFITNQSSLAKPLQFSRITRAKLHTRSISRLNWLPVSPTASSSQHNNKNETALKSRRDKKCNLIPSYFHRIKYKNVKYRDKLAEFTKIHEWRKDKCSGTRETRRDDTTWHMDKNARWRSSGEWWQVARVPSPLSLLPSTFISHERPVGRKMFNPCRSLVRSLVRRAKERGRERTLSISYFYCEFTPYERYMCIYSCVFLAPE